MLQTNQHKPHPNLTKVVGNHLRYPWQKPCPKHTQDAFDKLSKHLAENSRPLILDSFCGTGMSTARLAELHPDSLVIGVDKSHQRLRKHKPGNHGNYLLLRAEVESLWQCLAADKVKVAAHWILYPNPWPKASQFRRRVHGHGAFPLLAHLGGVVEMRTNWDIYAEEFTQASELIGLHGSLSPILPKQPMTLFEHKFFERGEILWSFRGQFVD